MDPLGQDRLVHPVQGNMDRLGYEQKDQKRDAYEDVYLQTPAEGYPVSD